MPTNELTRKLVYEEGLSKLEVEEGTLKNLIDSLNQSGDDISQADMLQLQYKMQSFTMFVQTLATIQKELSDMMKAIVAKF